MREEINRKRKHAKRNKKKRNETKLGPWGLLQKAKNLNFEGPFRGPKGNENIFFGIHWF